MMIDATHQSARSGSRRSCPSVATSCCGVGWNRRDKTAPFRPGRSLRQRTTLPPFILTSVHILPPSNSPGLANAPTTCQVGMYLTSPSSCSAQPLKLLPTSPKGDWRLDGSPGKQA